MKKNYLKIGAFILASMMVIPFTSCGDEQKNSSKTPPTAKPVMQGSAAASGLPNYRYVDLDSVLAKYALAKDFDEQMIRMENNAQSQMKQHETKIQNFAQQAQNKLQNNGYTSEDAVKADQQTMANMQNEAQKSMASLQENIVKANANAQKTLMDSINNFIETYNSTRGYDAIFYKNATMYINPALDITDEVVEGLNARYNKVKKK